MWEQERDPLIYFLTILIEYLTSSILFGFVRILPVFLVDVLTLRKCSK